MKRQQTHWETSLFLLAILLVGFSFRVVGLGWGEGQPIHPDEEFLRQVTAAISLPDRLSLYLDTANSPLNPYNRGYGFFVYGTLPLFLTRGRGGAGPGCWDGTAASLPARRWPAAGQWVGLLVGQFQRQRRPSPGAIAGGPPGYREHPLRLPGRAAAEFQARARCPRPGVRARSTRPVRARHSPEHGRGAPRPYIGLLAASSTRWPSCPSSNPTSTPWTPVPTSSSRRPSTWPCAWPWVAAIRATMMMWEQGLPLPRGQPQGLPLHIRPPGRPDHRAGHGLQNQRLAAGPAGGLAALISCGS